MSENVQQEPAPPRGPAIEAGKRYSVTLDARTLTPAEFGGEWLIPGRLNVLCDETLAGLLASPEGVKVVSYEVF